MAIRDNRQKNNGAELAGTLQQSAGMPIGNGHREAQGYAEERKGAARQNAVQVAERTATVRDTVRRTGVDDTRSSGKPMVGAGDFDAFETDFRGHHHTNAARRHGPYEHYRLVYRYGYDLGADPRYRHAAWSDVEQEARPRWEERNPGTWEQFQETIRYAWDTARGLH